MQMNATQQLVWAGPVIKLPRTVWSFTYIAPFTNFQVCLEEDEQWRETNLD